MSFNINANSDSINRHLEKARKDEADSLAKLSSGSRLEGAMPHPAERAIAESMESRLKSLGASKRNLNDVISLLQTADSGLSEAGNIVVRMKEINVTAAGATVGDLDRKFLMLEYQGLYDELNRIAQVTEFNGIPLLNGTSEKTPEVMVFRLDDPYLSDAKTTEGEDINTIQFKGMKAISVLPESLGLKSAKELLEETTQFEGLAQSDVAEMLVPIDEDETFATSYQQATDTLAFHRETLGAMQSRLNRTLDYIDVYQENISAAKSKIVDTDYAEESTNLLRSKILTSAGMALLAHQQQSNLQTVQLLNQLL